MGYKFYTLDVFTDRAFGGNQLAVIPHAKGLSAEMMAKIAIEFNFSETVFVFPPLDKTMDYQLRIFTPGGEIPFAGHPTIGTAYLLAHLGMVKLGQDNPTVILGEGAGNVPVTIEIEDNSPISSTLKAPQPPQFFTDVPKIAQLAEILSLSVADFNEAYPPMGVSCGFPFLIVPLNSAKALSQAKINLPLWRQHLSNYIAPHVYPCYRLDESNWEVRMFAPALNINEDPATGSAATAFAAYLAHLNNPDNSEQRWYLHQGNQINRPSKIVAIATKKNGKITDIFVQGKSVLVSEGIFY